MEKKVRVRFAPSPTGNLHVGNARTALFNWVFAKQNDGIFILKIDDTDKARSKKEFEVSILKDIKWLGLTWDEGPDIGGAFPPYRQSDRLGQYEKYANKLLDEKKAYKCFCTNEELKEKRLNLINKGKPPRYDGKCFSLSKNEVDALASRDIPHVIRFRVSDIGKNVDFTDLIKGRMSFSRTSFGDFVLLRSDKTASYNFAVVIDDATMQISHVIRGDDHLSNTPRQILIYNALGFDLPEFAHMPMIMGDDKKPLSKRTEGFSIGSLVDTGFLSDAVFNYLSLLGWSPKGKKEMLKRDEIVEYFSLKSVSRSHALFDMKKFKWLNKHYIMNLSMEGFEKISEYFFVKYNINVNSLDSNIKSEALTMFKENIEVLSEVLNLKDIMFNTEIDYLPDAVSVLKDADSRRLLEHLKGELKIISKKLVYQDIVDSLKKKGFKGKSLFMPLRASVTGRVFGPELVHVFNVLSKDVVLLRVSNALELQ